MTFLNPLVLIALIAAGIPLIIHLINLRKPRRVDFSSLAFLEELRRQTLRKLRIRQWLLLVLRTLAIASIVLAFARPTINSPAIVPLAAGRTSVAVILDNSASMDLRDQGGSYLSQAADFVESLASALEPSDELALLPLVDDGLPHPFGQPGLVGARLAETEISFGRASLGKALESAASTIANANNPNRQLYIISDLQRSNFVDTLTLDLSHTGRIIVVPVGNRVVANAAITRISIVSSIIEVDQPVTIEVAVGNFGDQEVRNLGLSVYLADERIGQSTVTLSPGQRAVVPVTVTPRERGWLKGRVVLEEDAFEHDNERFFVLHVPQKRRILLVRGTDRDIRFLELALSNQLKERESLFRIERVDEASLSGTFTGDYDAVVLVGVRRLTSGTASALSTFVGDGGGVLLFCGEEAAAGAYNQFLSLVGAGTFTGIVTADNGAAVTSLDRLDEEHPLFRSVFEDDERGSRTVERPSLLKLLRYRSGTGDEQTLLRTTIGLSMLQEIRHESGRVLIAPFLPEPQWTDLPVRGLFVPIVYRSMYYLTSADENTGGDAFSGGSSTLLIQNQKDAVRLHIVSESGQEWIPEQRALAQGLFITRPLTLRNPGIYDVIGDEGLLQRFVLNLDSRESDLERMPSDELSDYVERVTGLEPTLLIGESSDGGLGDRLRARQTDVEIWNVFLMLALIFLLAEMLVAARWRPHPVASSGT